MKKRNKKRRFNFVKFLLMLIVLYVIGFSVYKLVMIPIKHIRILNTTYLNDQSILKEAKLDNYPSFALTTTSSIRKNLKNNPYVKKVIVKKKWFCKLYLYVDEYKVLFYNSVGQLVLENGETIDNASKVDAPKVVNYVPDTLNNELIEQMSKVDNDILFKISEIEYRPNDVDKERFLLTMNDGNYVYLTLYTFSKINEYDEIIPTLEEKKGILYLDSGNYFEIID